MKKLSLLFSLLFIAASAQAFAQKQKGNGNIITQERSIPSFESLKVSGSFNVQMISSMEGKLSISTDENLLESIITEVKDDVLIIRNKNKHYLKTSRSKAIIIKVPLADVNNVKLSGSGKIHADSAIIVDDFKASSAGSGKINLSVKATSVSAQLSGSGKIILKGSATSIKGKHVGNMSVLEVFVFKALKPKMVRCPLQALVVSMCVVVTVSTLALLAPEVSVTLGNPKKKYTLRLQDQDLFGWL